MKAPQYQVRGSSTLWGAFISGFTKAPHFHKFWCFNGNLPDDISLLWWHFHFLKTWKTAPAKRLTKNQKIRGPSNLANPVALPKMLTVFFRIHNPAFSALGGFRDSQNESPSRGTRSPQLVLRGFHNLRLISFAAFCHGNKATQTHTHTIGLLKQSNTHTLSMLVVPFLLSTRYLCLSCNGSVFAVISSSFHWPYQHKGPRPRFSQSGPMVCP